MLTAKEKQFVEYWEKNRDKKKQLLPQLLPGLIIGLLMGAAILIVLDSGWYERANMVAATQLNPYILLTAVMAIAIFSAIFYKKHKWEMNEQLYKELKAKKENTYSQNNAANQPFI